MGRPVPNLVLGGLLGAVAALAISFGIPGLTVAFAGLALFVAATRSLMALSGVLTGVGSAWLLLGGSTYVSCVSGTSCEPGDGFLPFLFIAGVIATVGMVVGVIALARPHPDGGSRRP